MLSLILYDNKYCLSSIVHIKFMKTQNTGGFVIMDILKKILKLREERGWSEYKLAEKSGITQSTISTWYRKNMLPSISSLESICNAFNITLSQFFADDINELADATPIQKKIILEASKLNETQQNLLYEFLKSLKG